MPHIAEAVAKSTADLLLFPEACMPGYRHAVAWEGERSRLFALDLAARYHRHLALGFIEGNGCFLGLASPEGNWTVYQKQYPSPAEGRVWSAGKKPCIAETSLGRVGMLICADLLQCSAWEALRGKVDLVLISSAWPTYENRRAPPGFGWLFQESPLYRDQWISRAARALGVPVLLADASGPGLRGSSGIWDGSGRCQATGLSVEGHVERGTPAGHLRHEGRWRWFAPLYGRLSRGMALAQKG